MRTVAIRTICVLACLASASAALADLVYMKSGKVYQGEVTRSGDKVLVKTAMSGVPVTITLDAADIDHITESKGPARPVGTQSSAPPISLDTGRPLEDTLTRPEGLVFLAMQKLATTVATYGARQEIKQAQAQAHDGLRKADGKWLSPKDVADAKDRYEKILKDTRQEFNDLRKAATGNATARAEVPRRRRQLAAAYRKAADCWPDDLLSCFLTATAQLEGLDYYNAERSFSKCIEIAPRVAAFHQGKSLALAGRGKHVESLAEAVTVVELQPDSSDAVAFLKQRLEATPGNLLTDPTYVLAKNVLDLYTTTRSRYASRAGTNWLLPGKSVLTPEYTMPKLPMDRLEFRQAVGVPVGKNALLVDADVLNGAVEAFVAVDADTTVPGQVSRNMGLFGFACRQEEMRRARQPAVRPRSGVHAPDHQRRQTRNQRGVSFYAMPFYQQMGRQIRPVNALVRKAGRRGEMELSMQLLPGETAGAVIYKEGSLLGFLAGRTDCMAEGGGPSRFVPISEMASLLKRAQGNGYSSYNQAKRKVSPKPAKGQYFKVFVIAAEFPAKRSGLH